MSDDHDSKRTHVELRGVLQRARKQGVDPGLEGRLEIDEVSYAVVSDASAGGRPWDLRRSPRARTRLRSGKIARADGAFMCHCRIHDRSPSGMRLDLERRVALPAQFLLFDDLTDEIRLARAIWRRDLSVGVRIMPGKAPPLSPADAHVLRTSHYAIPKR